MALKMRSESQKCHVSLFKPLTTQAGIRVTSLPSSPGSNHFLWVLSLQACDMRCIPALHFPVPGPLSELTFYILRTGRTSSVCLLGPSAKIISPTPKPKVETLLWVLTTFWSFLHKDLFTLHYSPLLVGLSSLCSTMSSQSW